MKESELNGQKEDDFPTETNLDLNNNFVKVEIIDFKDSNGTMNKLEDDNYLNNSNDIQNDGGNTDIANIITDNTNQANVKLIENRLSVNDQNKSNKLMKKIVFSLKNHENKRIVKLSTNLMHVSSLPDPITINHFLTKLYTFNQFIKHLNLSANLEIVNKDKKPQKSNYISKFFVLNNSSKKQRSGINQENKCLGKEDEKVDKSEAGRILTEELSDEKEKNSFPGSIINDSIELVDLCQENKELEKVETITSQPNAEQNLENPTANRNRNFLNFATRDFFLRILDFNFLIII